MSEVRIGCAGLPARMSRASAFERVDFIEEDVLLRSPLPKDKALRRWRADAPEGRGFTLLASGPVFTNDDSARADLARVADGLGAEVVVFRPPPQHAPSQINRDHFRSLIRDGVTDARAVLLPAGLWDLDVCQALATELEIPLCFDPLANDPLEEIPAVMAQALDLGTAYIRVDRIGTTRRRLDELELETLAELSAELDTLWIAFAHGEKIRDGQALRALLAD